jgi:hypothetical protein
MSDERLPSPQSTDDAVDDSAPTERDPRPRRSITPSRGIALSVLWWVESENGAHRESGEKAND